MQVTFDTLANAVYVELTKKEVARTVEFSDSVMVDLDKLDMAVGIELLDPFEKVDLDKIKRNFHISSDLLDNLRSAINMVADMRVSQNQAAKGTPIMVANRWENDQNLETA